VAILAVTGIIKRFGGIRALDALDMSVDEGELVGIIGPNGSGKTTLFNCLTGAAKPDAGKIVFDDTVVTGWEPHQVALRGMVRTYQQIEVFPTLSALDNVLVAGQEPQRQPILPTLFRTTQTRRAESTLRARAAEVLEFVGLQRQTEERAGDLSYGQRKLLAIAMGLISRPRLLLLDEPTAGVNPVAIQRIVEVLRRLHAGGHTILLVEHNLPVVMELCERVIVLNSGRKLTEGAPDVVRQDGRVIDAYFGS